MESSMASLDSTADWAGTGAVVLKGLLWTTGARWQAAIPIAALPPPTTTTQGHKVERGRKM